MKSHQKVVSAGLWHSPGSAHSVLRMLAHAHVSAAQAIPGPELIRLWNQVNNDLVDAAESMGITKHPPMSSKAALVWLFGIVASGKADAYGMHMSAFRSQSTPWICWEILQERLETRVRSGT